LLPDAAAALNYVVENNRPAGDTGELLIVLVSAFSKTMPDFSKIAPAIPGVREALAKLPGQSARETTADGHLMAQAVAYGTAPRGATGNFSGEAPSQARTFKVWITITDTNATPPQVMKIPGIVPVLAGESEADAIAKKIAAYKKQYEKREVTLEKQ